MAVTVFKTPAGGGKTTMLANRIAHAKKNWRIEVYVPTHALAEEWRDKIKAANPICSVHIIGGRSHLAPDGSPLCRRHQVATQISQAGQTVYSRLCRVDAITQCRHYNGCKYIDQFDFGDVVIYTHAYLPLERGRLETRPPDLVVIDEAFAMVCLDKVQFNIALLRHPALPAAVSTLCADIANHLQAGTSLFALIAKRRKRGGGLHGACEALRAAAPRPVPGQSDQQVIQVLGSAPSFESVAKLLEHLGRAFKTKQVLQSVDFDATTGQITIQHRIDITRFKQKTRGSNKLPHILLLDATASREITEVFFPGATFEEYQAKRVAHVVQCRSSKCSKRSITPANHTDPKSMAEATHRLSEIQQLINELSANSKKLLVVGPAAVTGNPGKNLPPSVNVPPHSALAHFGALRGVDIYKDFDSVLVIGRNEPSLQAVQDLARAMFYDAAEPLRLIDRWVSQPRAYQLQSNPEGVEVDSHSDRRVQAILVQVRESESLQAIDRLRLIYCPDPKLVVLLSNIPLDVEVDALVTWDELVHGSRLEQAWRAAGDVMPMNPHWLFTNHSDLWPTEAAAKKDVQRADQKRQITNRFSIRNMSPFTFKYWVGRQRRPSKCLSRLDDPNAVSVALSSLLGRPVRVSGPLPDPPR